MESEHHAIIMGVGKYQVFDAIERQIGYEKCWLYQRCWAVFEMAIRDCIAVRLNKRQKSVIIVLDETFEEIESESGRLIVNAIADRFRSTDFYSSLRGRPGDIEEIKQVLVSPDFYRSVEEFNEHHRKRTVAMFVKNIPKVGSFSFFSSCQISVYPD